MKPNVSANGKQLLLVKSSVAASMKSTKYVVYCHLNQETGDKAHAKCSCKAVLGGCCRHFAALLNTLLDYSNLGLSYTPENTTCTKMLQKWNIPGRKLNSNVTVMFSDIQFEKSDFMRDIGVARKGHWYKVMEMFIVLLLFLQERFPQVLLRILLMALKRPAIQKC